MGGGEKVCRPVGHGTGEAVPDERGGGLGISIGRIGEDSQLKLAGEQDGEREVESGRGREGEEEIER